MCVCFFFFLREGMQIKILSFVCKYLLCKDIDRVIERWRIELTCHSEWRSLGDVANHGSATVQAQLVAPSHHHHFDYPVPLIIITCWSQMVKSITNSPEMPPGQQIPSFNIPLSQTQRIWGNLEMIILIMERICICIYSSPLSLPYNFLLEPAWS